LGGFLCYPEHCCTLFFGATSPRIERNVPMNVLRHLFGETVRKSRSVPLLLLGLVVLLVASCSGGTQQVDPADSTQPEVRFAPENGSEDVSPAEPVLATADRGRIVEAELTNEDGERV